MEFLLICFYSVIAYYAGFFLFLIIVTGGTGQGETKEDVLIGKGIGLVLAIVTFGTSI